MYGNSFLFSNISDLHLIDVKRLLLLKRLTKGDTVFDLLSVLPVSLLRRHLIEEKDQINTYLNQLVTFQFHVQEHIKNTRKKMPYRIVGFFGKNKIPLELLFFRAYDSFLKKTAPNNAQVLVSGKLQLNQLKKPQHHGIDKIPYQMIHPDYIGPLDKQEEWVGPERIYPLTAGITQMVIRKLVDTVLKNLQEMPEWLFQDTLTTHHFPSFTNALRQLHHPQTVFDLSPLSPARLRLAYDELFAKQLAQLFYKNQKTPVHSLSQVNTQSPLLHAFREQLPFQLTQDQWRAISDIEKDLQRSTPMHRLLQGDVGSGKTVVALAAALFAIEGGGQAAFLAPTDILVRQHFESIKKLLGPLNISVALLTSKDKGKARKKILTELEDGTIQLLVGTHAIFQENVIYHRLSLAIIDEQHRFGVKQRLDLASKAQHTHVLSMTATPIPRTLLLSQYGEMDVSKILEKPKNRKEVHTKTINLQRIHDIIAYVQQKIENREKVFWVCPLVEESEKLDLAAATKRFEDLKALFGDVVVLTHGRQTVDEKQRALNEFANGSAQLLVATTVIEVGVDVPSASVMIVEHAERFGLAQLHQLRGRIGRGTLEGTCILLYAPNLTYIAKRRLMMMKQTTDGFRLAEEDLRLRGGGDPSGLRQSGLPDFKFAIFDSEDETIYHKYTTLYDQADQDARRLMKEDPTLSSLQGQAALQLMQLFHAKEGEQFKKSG